jgi:uroporphyrinogen-III synthase
VGEATAAAAREAGFSIAMAGGGGVDSLLDSLPKELRLLHLCGADRRAPVAPRQIVTTVTVYSAAEIPSPAGIERLRGSVVALHSPRAASRLAQLVDAGGIERASIALAAMSAGTAAVAGNGWQVVESAAEPTDAALLALASRLCHNP